MESSVSVSFSTVPAKDTYSMKSGDIYFPTHVALECFYTFCNNKELYQPQQRLELSICYLTFLDVFHNTQTIDRLTQSILLVFYTAVSVTWGV